MCQYLSKLQLHITFELVTPLLEIYPLEAVIYVCKAICTNMLSVVVFVMTTAKNKKPINFHSYSNTHILIAFIIC